MSDRKPFHSPRKYGLSFHSCYATVIKAVDARYDIRGYMLAELVKLCLKNRARVLDGRRTFYECHVQLEALTYLECFTANLLFGPGGRLCPHEYHYVASDESLLREKT
ncbi:hypothetical protein MO767_26805 [Pseudomonas sp. UYIF39]|nr:hypothetical protein [Pseudomonas sp. UYIF39]MDI3357923.1 hypothetical protein [Pseudomonas sp. UYIF39]